MYFNKYERGLILNLNDKINIVETFCMWSDLLGYGSAFYQSNWNLLEEMAQSNLKRIKILSPYVRSATLISNEKLLCLNDGFIRNLDFRNLNISEIILWLELIIENFYYSNRVDLSNGFYGLRGVLTYGHRAEYCENSLRLGDCTQATEEKKKLLNEITIVYSPKEFQMNTVFTKAYIIESSGSKYGVKSNNLYIDIEFINKIVQIINESCPEKMLLVDSENRIDNTQFAKFSAKFEINEKFATLKIQKCFNQKLLDYQIINFSNVYIEYKNESKNINTHLYVATNIWSVRDEDFIFDLTKY